MVCVKQARRLLDSSYPRLAQKSTALDHPSQFVYRSSDFDQIHEFMFTKRSKRPPHFGLTERGACANI